MYAAAIYSKTIDGFGKLSVSLLCTITRVRPLKTKITLPKLELTGAMLLAMVMVKW